MLKKSQCSVGQTIYGLGIALGARNKCVVPCKVVELLPPGPDGFDVAVKTNNGKGVEMLDSLADYYLTKAEAQKHIQP